MLKFTKRKYYIKYLYLVINEVGRYKIGMSINVESRMKTLKYSGGVSINLVQKWPTEFASTFEEFLHIKYNQYHHFGEWFNIPYNPEDEIYYLYTEFCKETENRSIYDSTGIIKNLEKFLPKGAVSHKRSGRLARY